MCVRLRTIWAQVLGCGAHLSSLRRLAVGPFSIDQAVTLQQLADDDWQQWLLPPSAAVTHLARVDLAEGEASRLMHGLAIAARQPVLKAWPVHLIRQESWLPWCGPTRSGRSGGRLKFSPPQTSKQGCAFITIFRFRSLDTPSNLSIGNFDGVHLGHQALLRAMAVDAHQQGRQAGLLTFDPHPATVLRPHSPQPYLTTIAERLAVLRDVGLDFVVVYPFTLETAHTPAASFIARLKDALHLRALWVGPDFALGRNREGDIDSLRVLGKTDRFHSAHHRPADHRRRRSAQRAHPPASARGTSRDRGAAAGPALPDQRHRGGWRAPRTHYRLPDRQSQRAAWPAFAC